MTQQYILVKFAGGELQVGDPVITYNGEKGVLTGLIPPVLGEQAGKARIEVNHWGKQVSQDVTPATIQANWLLQSAKAL